MPNDAQTQAEPKTYPKGRVDPQRYRRKMKPHHQQDVRDKIQVSALLDFLGRIATTGQHSKALANQPGMQNRIAAAKILLDRVVPVLSAVEQTRVDVLPPETELIATIQRLIASNPALIAALGAHAPLIGQSSTIDATPAAQQSVDDAG